MAMLLKNKWRQCLGTSWVARLSLRILMLRMLWQWRFVIIICQKPHWTVAKSMILGRGLLRRIRIGCLSDPLSIFASIKKLGIHFLHLPNINYLLFHFFISKNKEIFEFINLKIFFIIELW
jgi:hypothetical protein